MTVLPMRKIALVMVRDDAAAIMKSLHHFGAFHIESSPHGHDMSADIMHEELRLEQLRKAIAFLTRFIATPNAIPPKHLDEESLFERVFALCEESARLRHEIDELTHSVTTLAPFGDWNQSTASLASIGLELKLACMSDDQLALITNHDAYEIVARVEHTNFVAIFARPNVDVGVESFAPPTTPLSRLRARLTECEAQSFAIDDEASRWAYQLRKLETLLEKTNENLERLTELKKAHDFGTLIGLHGFVLQRDIEALKKSLVDYTVAMSIEEPNIDDDIPVMLANPPVLRSFTTIIKAFSGVNYFERDKTGIVAILFMLFGSICFMDAGYGAVLATLGYVVALKLNRYAGQMMMWTGVAATAFGVLCGHLFGLLIGTDIMINIPPPLSLANDAVLCLKFSIVVGIITMMITTVVSISQNGLKSYATGNLFALLSGITMLINESGIFLGRFYDPVYVLHGIALGFLAACLSSWILFPEPVFGKAKHLANSLWMLYARPLALIHDVISHLRLFGIALSTALLAAVINRICVVLPAPLGLLFAPIGHLIVFIVSVSSLYLHSSSLVFLQFGAKCMTGGHHYFKPFARRIEL